MNNLDKILDRIKEDGLSEINSINIEKEKRVALIEEETNDKINDINARAEKTAFKEYEAVISRAESSGEMLEREIILKAKAELIEQIYSKAAEFIRSLPEEKYTMILSRFLANAVIERIATVREMTEKYSDKEFAGEAKVPFEVILSSEEREKYGRTIISKAEQYIANRDMTVPKIKLSKDSAPIKGGFIVRYGNAETNCAVSAMIASLRDKTQSKVARVLFS